MVEANGRVYIALMVYCLWSKQSPIFLTCAVMEVSPSYPGLFNPRLLALNTVMTVTDFFLLLIALLSSRLFPVPSRVHH